MELRGPEKQVFVVPLHTICVLEGSSSTKETRGLTPRVTKGADSRSRLSLPATHVPYHAGPAR